MTKAVLIAGGAGTRLQNEGVPKALASLDSHTTILDKQIELLNQNGVFNIILSLGFQAEQVIQHLKRKYRNHENMFEYVIEYEPLGTGGWLKLMKPLQEPFFVLNADNLIDYDMIELLRAQLEHPEVIATVGVTEVEDISESGSVLTQEDLILTFQEKTGQNTKGLVNAGHYVFTPRIWGCLPRKKNISLENDLFPLLARKNRLGCYKIVTDKFSAPDTPNRLRQAQKKWAEHTK